MSSLHVLLLLLCLCLHACNARHLRNIDNSSGIEAYLPNKEGEKSKLSIIKEKLRTQKDSILEDDARNGPNTIPIAFRMEEKNTMEAISGVGRLKNQSFVSSSQEGLQRSTQIMGQERQTRSVLESTPNDTEEIVDTNEPVEDVVVMDYAQPHRKPPIHNREP